MKHAVTAGERITGQLHSLQSRRFLLIASALAIRQLN